MLSFDRKRIRAVHHKVYLGRNFVTSVSPATEHRLAGYLLQPAPSPTRMNADAFCKNEGAYVVAQLMMMRLVCILLIVSLGQVPTVRISREAREIHGGGRIACLQSRWHAIAGVVLSTTNNSASLKKITISSRQPLPLPGQLNAPSQPEFGVLLNYRDLGTSYRQISNMVPGAGTKSRIVLARGPTGL